MKPRQLFVFFTLGTITLIVGGTVYYPPFVWSTVIVGPVLLIGIYDFFQTKHTITRNFPLLGHGRYLMEALRAPVQQYFIESDLDGAPINRMYRSLIYQRAKSALDTKPFGTQVDVYRTGYEWTNHSLNALSEHELDHDPRVTIGGPDCKQPYEAALLNVSAMSYGALSRNAILALNGGAKIGNFAHNTGEGGVSPYHLEMGGDLIWQIGTGYFGCRTSKGEFCPELFAKKSNSPNIKMIEIKLSQGAKPGHGGILPAIKNTEIIAEMRGVKANTIVISPPTHSAFTNPDELMNFIQKLRDLSNGKPIGFKLCVGNKSEFISLTKAMIKTNITPDFISVDGGEGGTGAAPLEFSNSIGMPLRDGLSFVHDTLNGFGLRSKVKIIASGKIFSGFHLFRAKALGADLAYSARAMMLALGCIQALECNKNNCPTGIATQDPELIKGLVVSDKKQRVAHYQLETVKSFVEILGANGLQDHNAINRRHVFRRVSSETTKRYDEIYPPITESSLLEPPFPESFYVHMNESDEDLK